MRSSRSLIGPVILVAAALLAGCGARAGGGETAAISAGAPLVVDLPNIVIDYDAEGNPSLAGAPLSSILPAETVASLQLGSALIGQLTAANIQHIQISVTPTGLALLVNGEPVPSVAWDGEKLATLGGLAANLPIPAVVQQLLPLVQNLGVGLSVNFPLSQGADLVAAIVSGEGSAAAEAATALQAAAAEMGSNPVIRIPIYYNADGSWKVNEIVEAQWSLLTGAPLSALNLPPSLIQNAIAAGITEATVGIDAAGIHVALNGQELPVITWDNGKLVHALELAANAGLLDATGLPSDGIVTLVKTFLPVIQNSNVKIQVFFPQ
jgi:sulfur carrier protein ThiS